MFSTSQTPRTKIPIFLSHKSLNDDGQYWSSQVLKLTTYQNQMSGEGDRRKMEKEGLEDDLDTKMPAREVAATGGNEQVRCASVHEDQREEDVEAIIQPSVATLPVYHKVRKSSESHKAIDFPMVRALNVNLTLARRWGSVTPFTRRTSFYFLWTLF